MASYRTGTGTSHVSSATSHMKDYEYEFGYHSFVDIPLTSLMARSDLTQSKGKEAYSNHHS
eukprot:scaffold338482_cov15-Prasinocladus_malaysianus.AAC.1